MKCLECGREIDSNLKFCKYCGTPVKVEKQEDNTPRMKCKACGAMIKQGVVYCTQCGTPVVNGDSHEEKKKKGKFGVFLVIFTLISVLLVGGLVFYITVGADMLNNIRNKSPKVESSESVEGIESAEPNSSMEMQTETSEEVKTSTEESEEQFSSEESSTESTDASSDIVVLGDTGSTSPVYPDEESDFVKTSNSEYTISYPKDFFYEGYYDPTNDFYYFGSEDKSITVTFKKSDAPFNDDPMSSANYLLSQQESFFVHDSQVEEFYEVPPKQVAESGFSRSIIMGQRSDDLSKSCYILYACNNSNVYTMTFTCPLDTSITNGKGVQYTPIGYVLDSMYRGWSISGSTYRIRTIEQYYDDHMGTKK